MAKRKEEEQSEEEIEAGSEQSDVEQGEQEDADDDEIDDNNDADNDDVLEEKEPPKKRKVHKLSLEKTQDFNETLRKRGVIYVARVPPRMNPAKVKQLLQGFGVVTRVYLVTEDQTVRKRRRKAGGSGAKRYTEGWVEMEKKKIAKHVAAALNNTPISNQKRNVHYGDLWNMRYLPKFQWSHLTEKVAYERRVREQKLRVEMVHARKENASYTQLVETGKKLDKIEARKRKRGDKSTAVSSESNHQRKQPRQRKPVDASDKAAKSMLLKTLM
jgi:ESF2/ABP1 family protein